MQAGDCMCNFFLLLFFEIILFLFALFLSGRDIMAPSVVFCIMFIISTLAAFLNISNWGYIGIDTILIFVSGILVFIAAEVFYRMLFCPKKSSIQDFRNVEPIYVKRWLRYIIIIFDIVVCVLYMRSIMKIVGGNMSSLGAYFVEYRRLGISSLKYGSEMGASGIINQLLRIVTASGYVAAYLFVNNMVAKSSRKSVQFEYLFIVVLSQIPGLMTAGRTGVLKIVAAFLIFYYIIWHQKYGWHRNLSWKYIRAGLVALLVGCPSFYYSLTLLGRRTTGNMVEYVTIYLGSSIQMFDDYIKNPIPQQAWGEESLVGIKKIAAFLGLGEASTSYNLEFRKLSIDHSSNVYTFFRRPLHDFGLFGMYIFVALIAIFFAWMYFRHIKYQSKEKCVGWVLAYGYLYYWIVCSSIVQYSVNYISVGAVIIIMLIIILYRIMYKFREK